MEQTTYIWGRIPRGLNLEMHSLTNDVPTEFNSLKPYNFSDLHIHKDFAIGVSHAAKITFEIPGGEGNYGAQAGGQEFEVLAIPCLDGNEMETLEDFSEIAQKVKCQDVEIMDDFNVPWLALQDI